jgi:ribosomal protein S27E
MKNEEIAELMKMLMSMREDAGDGKASIVYCASCGRLVVFDHATIPLSTIVNSVSRNCICGAKWAGYVMKDVSNTLIEEAVKNNIPLFAEGKLFEDDFSDERKILTVGTKVYKHYIDEIAKLTPANLDEEAKKVEGESLGYYMKCDKCENRALFSSKYSADELIEDTKLECECGGHYTIYGINKIGIRKYADEHKDEVEQDHHDNPPTKAKIFKHLDDEYVVADGLIARIYDKEIAEGRTYGTWTHP